MLIERLLKVLAWGALPSTCAEGIGHKMSDELRTKSIKIRVTADEFEQLKIKADRKPLAPFMRDRCLGADTPQRRRVPPKLDPEFARHYSNALNNLNQLTKKVNQNTDGFEKLNLLFELQKMRDEIEGLKKYASHNE